MHPYFSSFTQPVYTPFGVRSGFFPEMFPRLFSKLPFICLVFYFFPLFHTPNNN